MKKIFALLLAIVMVMGLATVVSAEDPETPAAPVMSTNPDAAINVNTTYIDKLYTVTGETTEGLYPKETLSFTSVPATTNPDANDQNPVNLTIDPLTVTSAATNDITIKLPTFTKAGVYKFTVTEDGDEATLGVTYDKESAIAVSVLVSYDWEATDYTLKVETFTVTLPEGKNEKDYNFNNQFDLGTLEITKNVTGNLGSENDSFDIVVTFAVPTDKTICNDVKYTVAGGAEKTIAAADIAKPVTITLKHGQTAKFVDLPVGLTYTVVEKNYTDGDENTVNGGYDAAKYSLNGAADTTTSVSDSISAAEEKDTVKITNNKETNVATGIVMDSVPFVVMAVIAVLGLAAFTAKKRVQE